MQNVLSASDQIYIFWLEQELLYDHPAWTIPRPRLSFMFVTTASSTYCYLHMIPLLSFHIYMYQPFHLVICSS